MLTPFSKPRLLAAMKSAAGPWNHVALIQPSGCHVVANRSLAPASQGLAVEQCPSAGGGGAVDQRL